MENVYSVLNISPKASAAEIKRAFRKKVKSLHPDIPHNATDSIVKKANERALMQLIHAYETLLDAKKRAEFDFAYNRQQQKQAEEFNYRQWLQSHSDPKSRAMLIFFDLFHDEEDAAVQEFLRLRYAPEGFTLAAHFNREDFMDCGFVMAEELFFRHECCEAFLLIEQIIIEEKKKPYFRHFFPEVLLLARNILRDDSMQLFPEDLLLECYIAALQFGLSKHDNAEIFKRMAEIYYRIGDMAKSNECILEAWRLNPRLKNTQSFKKIFPRI